MTTIQLTVSLPEANLLLEGLGHLPFARVHTLVGKLQQQAHRQLEPTTHNVAEAGAEPGGPEGTDCEGPAVETAPEQAVSEGVGFEDPATVVAGLGTGATP